MIEIIKEAASNFCQKQLDIKEVKLSDLKEIKGEIIASYIDIEIEKSKKERIYLFANRDFIQFVAQLFLFEEESDEETILDMMLECTNLIVGSAKVVASKRGLEFNISTPHIEKIEKIKDSFDESFILECDGRVLMIALKRL